MEAPLTASESLTATLCERSFLKLWTYPRVFRDQGLGGGRTEGKEICDLLTVCGEDVLIFSVKECRYKDTGRVAVDWARWFNRAILHSAAQVRGAEKWILRFPNRVFLDRACERRLPIELPRNPRFHRILVALGSREACTRFRGGEGAIRIYPSIRADEHVHPQLAEVAAFAVGNVAPELGWVHVLDDVSLSVVLNELDTITDFVRYLQKKEAITTSGQLGYAATEQDLLAVYLTNMDGKQEHGFPGADHDEPSQLAASTGTWSDFAGSREYAQKKAADEQSYLWDHVIQRFGTHALDGTLVDSHLTVNQIESGLRTMALEPRMSRRVLSAALGGLVAASSSNSASRRYVLSYEDDALAYVFMVFPANPGDQQHRRMRRQLLSDCCLVFGSRFRELRRVIGIATEAGLHNELRSEDLLVFDVPQVWPTELETEANSAAAELGILNPERLAPRYLRDDEYRTGADRDEGSIRDWLRGVIQRLKPEPFSKSE